MHNDLRNFSYLLYEDTTGESWVIDPFEAEPIIKFIRENSLRLSGILNTHHHWDHVQGNAPLQKAFNAEVVTGTSFLETLATPGHTMDHKVFILNDGHSTALFAGDTLFNSGVGNCKNGGDVNFLYRTTMMLKDKLPPSTVLYPGHDYIKKNLEFAQNVEPDNGQVKEELRRIKEEDVENRTPTTLAQELLVNPFLRTADRETFIKLREKRDTW